MLRSIRFQFVHFNVPPSKIEDSFLKLAVYNAQGSDQLVHKKVDKSQKKVEEEEKSKDFYCWICKNVSSTKSAKELTYEKKT